MSIVSAEDGTFVSDKVPFWIKPGGMFSFANAPDQLSSRDVHLQCDLVETSHIFEMWAGLNGEGNSFRAGGRCPVGTYISYQLSEWQNGGYWEAFGDPWYKSTEADILRPSEYYLSEFPHLYAYYLCYDCEDQQLVNPNFVHLGENICSPDGSYLCYDAYNYLGEWYCDDVYRKPCELGCEDGICENPTKSMEYFCYDNIVMWKSPSQTESVDPIEPCTASDKVCKEFSGQDPSAKCVIPTSCDGFDISSNYFDVDGECNNANSMKCKNNIVYTCQAKAGINCWVTTDFCDSHRDGKKDCQVTSESAECILIENCEGTAGECSFGDEYFDINGKCNTARTEVLKCRDGCWTQSKACMSNEKCVNSKCMSTADANEMLEDAGIDPSNGEQSTDDLIPWYEKNKVIGLIAGVGGFILLLLIVVGLIIWAIRRKR